MGRRSRIASLIALGAAVLGLGLALWGRMMYRRAMEASAHEVGLQAERLGAALQSAAGAARMRAEALAAMPVVRAGIETDAATVKDLARNDFVFRPGKNETIELFQNRKSGGVSLLRLPPRAAPLRVDEAREVGISADANGLRVTVAMAVEPLYGHDQLRGTVAIGTRVDLEPFADRLRARNLQVVLTGLETPLELTGRPSQEPPGILAKVPDASDTNPQRLVLQARLVGHPGSRVVVAGQTLLGLGILAAVLMLLHQRRQAAALQPREDTPTAPVPLSDEPGPLPRLVPVTGDSTLPPETDLLAGRYRIFEHIGAGGAADVFLAQPIVHAGVPKVLAVKVLRPAFANPSFGTAFLQGAEVASKLSHHNIVRIHDYGNADGTYFIAMEYVEGCNLATLLAELRRKHEVMPPCMGMSVAIALCRALEVAHSNHVIHRDVNPANILIGRHGAIKLTGFSITNQGTSDYVAPEQHLGQPVDRRADLYAVGAILHELCTGQHVPLAMPVGLDTHKKDWPNRPRPSSLRAELPRKLDAIVAKALRYSAKQRYATAADLEADLEDLLAATGTAPGVLADWVDRVHRPHHV